ncbi:MAG: glycosyltransferase family 4 protein [Deltaproteobacteria bacterium]|nr:glycosyltransferase family 4 protein [Deltaproteobacteria bacterium]
MPLTILTVAALPFPTRQGTQVLIGEICGELARRGHRVHLLCYAHRAFEERGALAYEVHRLPDFPRNRSVRSGPSVSKILLDVRLAAHARRLARAVRADVVHAHGHEAILATALPPRIPLPIVHHAHTSMGPELPTYFEARPLAGLARAAGEALDWVAPRLADATAAVSLALARACGGAHVPPAVRLPGPPATAVPVEPRVVYAGNLDRYQGLDALLAAVASVDRAELVIVSASFPGPIAARAAAVGIARRVRFVPHGDVEDVRRLLASASVVVVPRGIPTGFPIKLLEALGSAAPVIVSRRVAEGIVDGLEARVVDDDGLADAIDEILSDPRGAREMGARGRQWALAHHDPSRAADLLEEVFARAIRARTHWSTGTNQ